MKKLWFSSVLLLSVVFSVGALADSGRVERCRQEARIETQDLERIASTPARLAEMTSTLRRYHINSNTNESVIAQIQSMTVASIDAEATHLRRDSVLMQRYIACLENEE